MKNEQPKMNLVVAGGGFGGIRVVRKLARTHKFNITLISDRDTFRYYPALYATATGHSYEESIIPLEHMLKGLPNVRFVQDKVTTLDSAGKRIQGESGEWYTYDSLILALGVVTNYFGIEGLQEFSFGIKTEEEITEFKRHLHANVGEEQQKDTASYVVVGAGPTGIQLSSALKGYVQHVAFCHGVKYEGSRIKLIEAMSRVLPKMPERASRMVEKRLADLGIEVMLNSKVEGETANELHVNGQAIKTRTVVWTSGVANSPFFKANQDQFKLAPNGKANVDAFLQGTPSAYVIGDNAATPYSGLTQTALHDADFIARNLKRQMRRIEPRPYKPKKPPVIVPVGKMWSLVEWGPFIFAGRLGAMVRRCADLIGYSSVLPFRKAIDLWLKASHLEEECPICQTELATPQHTAHDDTE